MNKTEIDPSEEVTGDGFTNMDLRPELLNALSELGYEEPTPIQAEAIPAMLSGTDLLGQAATGTGKTAAFALPILQRLDRNRGSRSPIALVLVPTRELAMQVSEAMHSYGRTLGARVVPIYGGAPIGRQLQSLERGVDIVVATPGRALDHIKRGRLDLTQLEVVVLDEADEMMDMGFAEDLDAIIDATPKTRQTVLFSATMPKRVDSVARKYLTDPHRITIARPVEADDAKPRVRQTAYVVARSYKAAAIGRILDVEMPTAAIVFCRTREQVDTLTETLNARGYRSEALHGGMNQDQRERVLNKLRAENAELLIATDVAARGLDIDHLTHVINYDVPASAETYVHRIGRVGRAGREGVAITMTEPREHYMLKTIERTTKQHINVENLPTVAEVKAKRIDITATTIRDAIAVGDFDQFRAVLGTLTNEFDINDIALAAIKLVHGANGADDEKEIPVVDLRDNKSGGGNNRDRNSGGRDRDRGDRGGRFERNRNDRGDRGDRPDRGERNSGGNSGPRRESGPRESNGNMTRIFVGAGKEGGVRPQDLVGAIANETSLSGKQIGSIDISDRFSLVEVPTGAVNEVINALKSTTIKGQRVNARRERF